MMAASEPSGWLAHDIQQRFGVFGRADRHQLALVRDVEGVEAQQLAGGGDFSANRDGVLLQDHADAGLVRDLIQRGRQPATGRIAHDVDVGHRRDHGGHETVQRRAVR